MPPFLLSKARQRPPTWQRPQVQVPAHRSRGAPACPLRAAPDRRASISFHSRRYLNSGERAFPPEQFQRTSTPLRDAAQEAADAELGARRRALTSSGTALRRLGPVFRTHLWRSSASTTGACKTGGRTREVSSLERPAGQAALRRPIAHQRDLLRGPMRRRRAVDELVSDAGSLLQNGGGEILALASFLRSADLQTRNPPASAGRFVPERTAHLYTVARAWRGRPQAQRTIMPCLGKLDLTPARTQPSRGFQSRLSASRSGQFSPDIPGRPNAKRKLHLGIRSCSASRCF